MDGMKWATVFILLLSLACATNINDANYTQVDPTYYFRTDMQFTSAFTATLQSGSMVSGNPNNIQSGDRVSDGSVIRIIPSVSALWATPDFSALAQYPSNDMYCAAMVAATGGVRTNNQITWMPAAAFDTQKAYGDRNPASKNISRGDELAPYVAQPVSYDNRSGISQRLNPQTNKRGSAQVFCKGTLQIVDNGTVVASSEMPLMRTADITIRGTGAHQVITRLSGVQCFALIEKYPDQRDVKRCYDLFFYTGGNVVIPPAMADYSATITVDPGGGSCNISNRSISARVTPDPDQVLLAVGMHNDGRDSVQVYGVINSNPAYTVIPFPVSLCGTLGLPASLCPASNGFNTTIAPNAVQGLSMLFVRNGGTGTTTLTFLAHTTLTNPNNCTDDVFLNDSDDHPFDCTIDPASADLPVRNVRNFDLECHRLSGAQISCIGEDWSWTNMNGDFINRTNTFARAFTLPPPALGELNYHSDMADCLSVVDSRNPSPYNCTFVPSSVTLAPGQSQYFQLICNVTPNHVDYSLVNGLQGTISNPSIAGVNYTAPVFDTSGQIRADVQFPGSTIGYVADATVIVMQPDITSCEIAPPVVAPPAIELSSMAGYRWDVTCRNRAGTAVPCIGTDWRWEDGLTGQVVDATNEYAYAYSDSPGGSRGNFTYYTFGANCSSDVTLVTWLTGWCEFNPAYASLKHNASQHFTFSCFDNRTGTPVPFTPVSSVYRLLPGLGGDISNETIAGVDYTAPDENTSGILEGQGWTPAGFVSPFYAAQAGIRVTDSGTGSDDDRRGDTEWCKIGEGPLSVSPGKGYWLGIKCGKFHNETCPTDTIWTVEPPGILSSWVANGQGITFTVSSTAEPGSWGEIFAVVKVVSGIPRGCSKPFYVKEPDCYEDS